MNEKHIISILDNVNTRLNMNNWEKDFVDSIKNKIEKNIPLSSKQQIKLWDIYLRIT